MKALHVEQSLPICCSLAALGGILEVAATAVTAVPAVREKEGIPLKWGVQWLAICGNVGLQAVGSLLSHLIATWFGPVSVVVPFFYSATLLSNMLIFGLLGERFTKNMRVGTHVIVAAVILLPVVGPDIQDHQDISSLFRHWYSIVWFTLLLVACAITGLLLVVKDVTQYPMSLRTTILLVARAASISVNLTVSRAFIMGLTNNVLMTFIVIKVLSGAIYTYAIVVQSFAVEQARFVPLNATTIILVNALTGIIIWEDWRVLYSWYGYFCIFVLLGLGCDLLLSVPLLNAENPEFGTSKRAASMILQQRQRQRRLQSPSNKTSTGSATTTTTKNTTPGAPSTTTTTTTSSALLLHISSSHTPDYDSCSKMSRSSDRRTTTGRRPSSSSSSSTSNRRLRPARVDAWKELLSPIQSRDTIDDDGGGDDDDNNDADSDDHDHDHDHDHDGSGGRNNNRPDVDTIRQEGPRPSADFQTPQPAPPPRGRGRVGNAIKDATLLMAQQPMQLGGRFAKAAAAMVVAGSGSGCGVGLDDDSSREANDVEQQPSSQLHPPHYLSRLAAWRETVSPIRSQASRRRRRRYDFDDVEEEDDEPQEIDDDDDNDEVGASPSSSPASPFPPDSTSAS